MFQRHFSHIQKQEQEKEIPSFKQSFYLNQKNKGLVILVHGFSACPGTMKRLGAYLHGFGWDCYGHRLAGHAESLDVFEKTSFMAWRNGLEDAIKQAANAYQDIILIGCSTGALLSLQMTQIKQVKALVSLSLFLKPQNKWFYLLKGLKLLAKLLPMSMGRIKNGEIPVNSPSFWYTHMPIRALIELEKCKAKTIKQLQHVTKPVLLLQSKEDKTAHPDSAQMALNHLNKSQAACHWVKGEHVFILREDQKVDTLILDFIQKHKTNDT